MATSHVGHQSLMSTAPFGPNSCQKELPRKRPACKLSKRCQGPPPKWRRRALVPHHLNTRVDRQSTRIRSVPDHRQDLEELEEQETVPLGPHSDNRVAEVITALTHRSGESIGSLRIFWLLPSENSRWTSWCSFNPRPAFSIMIDLQQHGLPSKSKQAAFTV